MASQKAVSVISALSPTNYPEPILTREQVADRLQLPPSTIYELTRRRNARPMPVLRVGKYLRFRWSDIERWLASYE